MKSYQPHRTALRLSRRAVLLSLSLLLILAQTAGCGRAGKGAPETQDNYTVTFATEPAPPIIGASAILLTLRDATGQPVDGARVTIEANMSHAGMKPVQAEVTGGQAGTYRVPLEWTMSGDWFVDVSFTLPDGQVIGRRFPTRVK